MIELSCLPFCIGFVLVERMCKKDWLCGRRIRDTCLRHRALAPFATQQTLSSKKPH